MGRLNDTIALVTGGTAGIGLACAELLGREGATVVVVGRDPSKGEAVRRDFDAKGWKCDVIQADLSKRAEVRSLFASIEHRYARLDFAINNAGIDGASFTRLTDYPEDAWDAVLELNLTSVWLCMKYELELMSRERARRADRSIVNMASLAGLKASYSGGCAYTASKHGLVGLTKSAAVEYASAGIRINAICPGIVRTPLAEAVMGDALASAASFNPMGRLCEPEEVAQAALWLCTASSAFITGVALPVDGGIMAR
jgi:NAD(P)-dependent dehydrogenase (short-subunit alcohol dehydrogenase family)